MADRNHWLRRIATLDPERDHEEIVRTSSQHEFPWDTITALSFALFRTYAVPSIGRLLHQTGEFTERTQKRYDDTVLLLDAPGVHGLESPQGRAAIRRINQMHRMYAISDDDMRYVLSTFVAVPIRWMDAYAWRPYSEIEKQAAAHYYSHLGRLMNIPDLPATWSEYDALMDDYEAAHFAHDPGAVAVADATMDLMCTFPLNRLVPAPAFQRFARALMDEPLLDAFGYAHPTAVERRLAVGALRARSAALRLAPPRRDPVSAGELEQVRGYPDGYRIEDLGTHRPAPGCPVRHAT